MNSAPSTTPAQAPGLDRLAKKRIALRYWLLGAGYVRAAEAMDYAEQFHTGFRKDGVTPEFSHQVAIAGHVRTFALGLRHPEEAIITAFLHDVREDYDVPDARVRELYGDIVADAVGALTKEFEGTRFTEAEVFANIAQDPVASVVKLCDRIHNHSTMVGVFSRSKVEEYIEETRTHFFPMVKRARRHFSDQEPVYEALTLTLGTQLDLLDAVLQGVYQG